MIEMSDSKKKTKKEKQGGKGKKTNRSVIDVLYKKLLTRVK